MSYQMCTYQKSDDHQRMLATVRERGKGRGWQGERDSYFMHTSSLSFKKTKESCAGVATWLLELRC